MSINFNFKEEIVCFLRILDDNEKRFTYYTRDQLLKIFKFMGIRHVDSYKMTKLLFKTLTKAVKRSRVKLGVVKDEDEDSDEEEESNIPSLFSSSTDTATTLYTKKVFYQKRFLSLEEFGLKPKKVKQGRDTKYLLKKMATLMSKLLLKKYSYETWKTRGIVCLTVDDFYAFVKICLVAYNYNKKSRMKDFRFSCEFEDNKNPLIILIGGTCGSGKSTVSSILSSKLGINKSLSTDSIRHMIREFSILNEKDSSILFSSSYNTGDKFFSDISDKKQRIITGFEKHCSLLVDYIDNIIKKCKERNESIVIEGVHLTIEIMMKFIKKYNCLGYLIYVSSETKHINRISVRSKYMTLDPRHNEYIKYMPNIRIIQDHLLQNAQKWKLPNIDNENVDKSLHLLHNSIFRTAFKMRNGNKIFDEKENKILIVDPNNVTISIKKKRMTMVLNKKRRMFNRELFQDYPKKRKNRPENQTINKKKEPKIPKPYFSDSHLESMIKRKKTKTYKKNVATTPSKKNKNKKKKKLKRFVKTLSEDDIHEIELILDIESLRKEGQKGKFSR